MSIYDLKRELLRFLCKHWPSVLTSFSWIYTHKDHKLDNPGPYRYATTGEFNAIYITAFSTVTNHHRKVIPWKQLEVMRVEWKFGKFGSIYSAEKWSLFILYELQWYHPQWIPSFTILESVFWFCILASNSTFPTQIQCDNGCLGIAQKPNPAGTSLCIIRDKSEEIVNAVFSELSKALVLLNSSLVAIYFAFELRKLILKAHDPSTYFEITYFICDSLYLLVMLHFFGRRGREMLEIFNEVQITAYEFSNGTKGYRKVRRTATVSRWNSRWFSGWFVFLQKKIKASIICSLCVSCMLLSFLETLQQANWKIHDAFESFATSANVVFRDILAPLNFERRAQPVFLTLLCIWSTMYERILNSFSDILFTMTALWFRSLVRSFLKIAADPSSSPDKVSDASLVGIKNV